MALFKNEIIVSFLQILYRINRDRKRERKIENEKIKSCLNEKITGCTYIKQVLKLEFTYKFRFLKRICKVFRFNCVTKASYVIINNCRINQLI